MARRWDISKPGSAPATALRMLVAFALAFSTALGGQAAFAEGADSGTDTGTKTETGETGTGEQESGEKEAPKPEPEPDPDPEPTPKLAIDNFSVYIAVNEEGVATLTEDRPTSDVDSYASARKFAQDGVPASDGALSITKRDGEMKLGTIAEWNNGDSQFDPGYFTFAAADDASAGLVTVSTDEKGIGTVKATGGKDGVARVAVTLRDGYASQGAPSKTVFEVKVSGQETTPYVTELRIFDGDTDLTGSSYTFPKGVTAATATIAFTAKVSLHYPDGSSPDVTLDVTAGNGLSKQTQGAIADLKWEEVYDDRGKVSQEGEYRATVEGDNTVRIVTNAGLDGATLVAETMVTLEGEGHAQGSITIDAVRESHPDQLVLKPTTFTVKDIESLNKMVTRSYTVYGTFGTANFVTYTGRGIYFADLLEAVGVKSAEVLLARFDCWDTKGYEVSRDKLIDTNRYYFPDLEIGNKSTGEQVPPMLAIESGRAPQGSSDPVPADKMTNQDCFRLLYGVQWEDEMGGELNTRQDQRRWVNAIHLTLRDEGVKNGDGDHDDEDDTVRDDERGTRNTPSDATQDVPTDAPGNGDAPGEAGGGQGSDAGIASTGGGGAGAGRKNAGAWSVLQAVSKSDSDVDALEFDNPFRPYTAPVCAGLFAAGGVEAFARFRWQKRKPSGLAEGEG